MEKIFFSSEGIARIIGKNGLMKKKIEKNLDIKIKKNEDDSLMIDSKDKVEEFLLRYFLDAIALGFPFNIAMSLIKSDKIFKQIDIKNFSKNPSRIDVIKSRVIGKEGKAKKTISYLTATDIMIKENFIGIIGEAENVHSAEEAFLKIIRGAPHAHVYKFLESEQKRRKEIEAELEEFRRKIKK